MCVCVCVFVCLCVCVCLCVRVCLCDSNMHIVAHLSVNNPSFFLFAVTIQRSNMDDENCVLDTNVRSVVFGSGYTMDYNKCVFDSDLCSIQSTITKHVLACARDEICRFRI